MRGRGRKRRRMSWGRLMRRRLLRRGESIGIKTVQCILASGRVTTDMEKVFKYGLMEQDMKVIGNVTKPTEEANFGM